MLHLLLGTDWTANRDEVMKRIAADVAGRRGNRILMVPELISHETERRLCAAAGDTASRYAEVLSFTRLARRVADSMGSAAEECLDNGGRVVAMAAAAKNLSSRLKAYAAVETKPEFLTGLIDAVDEFKRCDLSRAAGETEGSLAQKLEELSLLMESYDALCSRGKRDPRDQMTWLLEQMEQGNFAREHVFYIDGFPDFTRQHLAILEHLIQASTDVTVSLNCDREGSQLLAFEKAGDTASQLLRCARRAGVEVKIETVPGKRLPLSPVRERLFQGVISRGAAKECLDVFRAESPYLECMGAAERIRFLLAAGCRCRDITVVCTDMTVYQPLVNLVFHRLHIPVYQSGTEDILQKSVIATVLMALDAALSGFDQKSILRYLRSALSPVDPDTCDRIENYAIIWDIRGQKWTQSWENHPDGLSGVWTEEDQHRLEELNTARELAIAPLTRLWQGFRDASDLRGQILALYGFLEDISLEMRLSRMAQELDAAGDNRAAQILNQLWEILLGALEQMYDMLGDTHWEGEQFIRLFRLLLSQYDVGTIPPVLDAVQVGPVSAMRCHQEKHLIVLGAEEGKLPGYSGSAGVLTDQERVTLRELGVPLTGGAMEGVQAEFAEIYGCFCGAMASVSVFCSGDQPSFVYRRLCELAGGEQQVKNTLDFAPADGLEAGAYLARWDAGDAAGRLNVRDTYLETCRRRDYRFGKVERETIGKLYGSTLNLSASQIDRQAECRLSYFLKYGLRVQERKEATIDPAEFGTYVHAVLENSARRIRELGGFHRVSLEETLEIAHGFSEEYAREHFSQIESERVTYLFRRHIQELDMVVRELWQELSEAAFAPAGFEVGFGDGEGLPPIPIPGGGMNAVLRGFIDRVDIWDNGASRYYRVVDYKTGKKSFDLSDLRYGLGIQMLLYLFTLEQEGRSYFGYPIIPAGVLYHPAREEILKADRGIQPEKLQLALQSALRRSGMVLSDPQVLRAMEHSALESPHYLPIKVKKDGSIADGVASAEQLGKLGRYVDRLLHQIAREIGSGSIDADPVAHGPQDRACQHCDFAAACGFQEGRGGDRVRYIRNVDPGEFWKFVEEESREEGSPCR